MSTELDKSHFAYRVPSWRFWTRGFWCIASGEDLELGDKGMIWCNQMFRLSYLEVLARPEQRKRKGRHARRSSPGPPTKGWLDHFLDHHNTLIILQKSLKHHSQRSSSKIEPTLIIWQRGLSLARFSQEFEQPRSLSKHSLPYGVATSSVENWQ